MNHRDVMKKYNEFVSVIEKRLGKNITTDNTELHQVGRELFGARFKGVYAADGVPALTVKEPYAVINNKPAASGGEHWLGAARIPRTGRVLLYDSYGRSHKTLLPGALPPGSHDTDRDIEQNVSELNCGQRSLAWLVVFDKLGPAAARLV